MSIISLFFILIFLVYTKRIYIALSLGILLQLLDTNLYNPVTTFFDYSYYIFATLGDFSNMLLILISFSVGFIVYIINKSNYNQAIAVFLDKYLLKINSKLILVLAMVFSSLFLFLETNFNSLSIVQIWRNHCDRLNMPREKFAIYVQILSLSSVVLVPLNIWGGIILLLIHVSGIHNVSNILHLVYIFNIVPFVAIFCMFMIELGIINLSKITAVENRAVKFSKIVRDKLLASKVQHYSNQNNYRLIMGFFLVNIILFLGVTHGFDANKITTNLHFTNYILSQDDVYLVSLAYTLFATVCSIIIYSVITKIVLSQNELLGGISTSFNLVVLLILCMIFYQIFANTFSYIIPSNKELLLILPVLVFVMLGFLAFFSGMTWFSYFVGFMVIFKWLNFASYDNYQYTALLISAIINAGIIGNLISKHSDTTQFVAILSECDTIDIIRTRHSLYCVIGVASCLFYILASAYCIMI